MNMNSKNNKQLIKIEFDRIKEIEKLLNEITVKLMTLVIYKTHSNYLDGDIKSILGILDREKENLTKSYGKICINEDKVGL